MDIKYTAQVIFRHNKRREDWVEVTLIAKFKKSIPDYEWVKARSGFGEDFFMVRYAKILKFIPPNSTRDGRKNIQVGRKGYY